MNRPLRKLAARRGTIRQLARVDHEVFEAVANTKVPLMDAILPPLTWAANYSKLWGAIAAAMSASDKPNLQRAAVRGLSSVAVTSLITNQPAKRVWKREHPGTRPFRFSAELGATPLQVRSLRGIRPVPPRRRRTGPGCESRLRQWHRGTCSEPS